jgi:hypothetical protein
LNKRAKILVGLFGVAGLLVATSAAVVAVYASRPCQVDQVQRTPSPDGRWEAVSYRAACGGATMPFATHIALLRPGAAPKGGGMIFSARATPVKIRWTAPQVLSVEYPSATEIFWSKSRAYGVAITEGVREGGWPVAEDPNRYADFANYNYGATGVAAGLSPQLLLRAAGSEQYFGKNANPRFGTPWGAAPYGDDFRDAEAIRQGIARGQAATR